MAAHVGIPVERARRRGLRGSSHAPVRPLQNANERRCRMYTTTMLEDVLDRGLDMYALD